MGRHVYLEQISALEAGSSRLTTECMEKWNMTSVQFFIRFRNPRGNDQKEQGHSYCDVRGEILGTSQDGQKRKYLPKIFSLIKKES